MYKINSLSILKRYRHGYSGVRTQTFIGDFSWKFIIDGEDYGKWWSNIFRIKNNPHMFRAINSELDIVNKKIFNSEIEISCKDHDQFRCIIFMNYEQQL